MLEKELLLDDLKELELGILNFLDDICRKNHIQYFLAAGTLLGAVRHQGFIPWDDDIDVTLLRSEYKKLIDVLKSEKGRYQLLSIETNDDYYYGFGKLVDTHTVLVENGMPPIKNLGVYIDIFPIDYFPNNDAERLKVQKKLFTLRAALWYSFPKIKHSGFIRKLAGVVFRRIGWKIFQNKLMEYCNILNENTTDYVGSAVATSIPYKAMRTEWFATSINLEFEGHLYPAPVGYKNYLEVLYGDYMELPPDEKRKTHHNFTAKLIQVENKFDSES